MTTYTITISGDFWHYHQTILGEIGKWRIVKANRKTTTLEMDLEALRELRFSAERVSEPWFHDMDSAEGRAIARAEMAQANRVLQAIVNQTTKQQAEAQVAQ